MNWRILLAMCLCCSFGSSAQKHLISGDYGGFELAFDPQTNLVTGFFDQQSGVEDETMTPKFSCQFYLQGKLTGDSAIILSYHPKSPDGDTIAGIFRLTNSNSVSLRLKSQHGGCYNVQQFDVTAEEFELVSPRNLVMVRYINAEKAYCYDEPNEQSRKGVFRVKGDLVSVQKTQGDWAYCYLPGRKIAVGWIKVSDLNPL